MKQKQSEPIDNMCSSVLRAFNATGEYVTRKQLTSTQASVIRVSCVVALIILFTATASATGDVTGWVQDCYTGDVLSDATVNLTSHAGTYTANTTTNVKGYYTITGLPADNYNIKVRAASSRYVPRSGYFAVTDGTTTTSNMYMYADTSISQSINFGVSEEVKKNTSIRLWWTSDLPTKGYIEYGATTSYGSETPDDDYSYAHFVEITGLAEETLQHYRIVSTDLHDTNYNSGDYNFTTLNSTEMDNLVKAARGDGALPKTYYVRTDGNDANTGLTNDAGGAWLTIDHAADTIDVGDTVRVQSGTYNEYVSISAGQAHYGHGISTHHIRFIADGNVIIDGSHTLLHAFSIDARSSWQGYVEIEGFKCYNQTHESIITLGARGIIIKNNYIENSSRSIDIRDLAAIKHAHVLNNTAVNTTGIECIKSEYVRIKNNSWADFSGYAVTIGGEYLLAEGNTVNNSNQGLNVAGASFATFRDNVVTHITDRSIRIGTGGTYAIMICNNTITSPPGATYLVTQYPNTMTTYTENTFRDGALTLKGDFTYVYNNSLDSLHLTGGSESGTAEVYGEKSVVEDNVFIDAGGIGVDRQLDCTIKNNILNHVSTPSFGNPAENVEIVNNVFYNATNAIILDNGVKDIIVKNNIFYNISGYCVNNIQGSNITIEYNDVWLNGSSAYYNVSDSNTAYQDPLFTDVSGGDFHLKSQYGRWTGSSWTTDAVSSPCIDAGVPYAEDPVYGDYSSEMNSDRVNLGAYGNTKEASIGSGDGTTTPLVTNLQNEPPTPDAVTLRWDCSTPDIDHYTIYQNGALLNTTGNKYYSATDLSPDTTFIFSVSATTTAGITSENATRSVQTAAESAENLDSNTVHIPDDITASRGHSVTVPIMIYNATEVACAGVKLTYDASVVTVTGATEGDFTTFFGFDDEHAADGWVVINTYINGTQLTGDVKVVDVTLEVVGEAGDTSTLDMNIISMANQSGYSVPGTVSNGLFTVVSDTSPPVVTDPSASQLIPDDTNGAPSWGETAVLNVTVTDESDIASVTIDLSAIGGSPVQPMTYIGNNVWSVTTNASAGTSPQTYDLPVCATDIHGYTNMSESVELVVMRNGDVTGDGYVKLDDVELLENYVAYPGRYTISSEFVADVTDDGIVNIADAMVLANYVASPDQPLRYVGS